ncbi:MAG: hypothetical protein IKF64_01760 [Eubacterium sp.]|nr:hypothetical protein [Eubacterium sp.]
MSKYYTEPVIELHKYRPASDVFTDSNPSSTDDNDLNDDDEYNYFGNN